MSWKDENNGARKAGKERERGEGVSKVRFLAKQSTVSARVGRAGLNSAAGSRPRGDFLRKPHTEVVEKHLMYWCS